MYELGLNSLPPQEHERWRVTFALAASAGGIWAIVDPTEIYALAVFWRTKNPHVNLRREFPLPDPTGTFLYVGWCWTRGWFVKDFKKYLLANATGIDFVAWHDQRRKRKKKLRGTLFTAPMPENGVRLRDALDETR